MGSTTGTAMTAALKKYISSGYRTVDGWLSAIAIKSTAELGALQKRLGVSGAVSEIGVHHGRLFILLHLLTDAPEKSVAWTYLNLNMRTPTALAMQTAGCFKPTS
jgi:hypothetical protein